MPNKSPSSLPREGSPLALATLGGRQWGLPKMLPHTAATTCRGCSPAPRPRALPKPCLADRFTSTDRPERHTAGHVTGGIPYRLSLARPVSGGRDGKITLGLARWALT